MSIRLPAEWEPLDGVLLTWPHRQSDWADIFPEIESYYLNLTRTIAKYTTVIVAVPKGMALQIGKDLSLENVRLYEVDSNDTWARDHGPITVYDDGQLKLLDFKFNGWGNKFDAELDNLVTRSLYTQGSLAVDHLKSFDFVLEGGGIESDGKGTLLTTSACLLNKNRNPSYSKAEIEALLKAELGVDTIHWLNHGHMAGDDTDCHIDTLARFCPNDTIVYMKSADKNDEHYDSLKKMEKELKALRTGDKKPYRLIPLTMPNAIMSQDGDRMPATYANFLICNGAVLVPTYLDQNDEDALTQIAKAFPDHEIVGVDSRVLITQNGSLHCITMHLPKGVLSA